MSLVDRVTELVMEGYNVKFEHTKSLQMSNRCLLRLGKDGYEYTKMVNFNLANKFEDVTKESIILMALDELVVMLNERIGE